jgi:hypothetical protein
MPVDYITVYSGSGGGYNKGDRITTNSKKIEEIAWEIRVKASLSCLDLGLLSGNEDKLVFGTMLDGITFGTPVLIMEKVEEEYVEK